MQTTRPSELLRRRAAGVGSGARPGCGATYSGPLMGASSDPSRALRSPPQCASELCIQNVLYCTMQSLKYCTE